MFKDKWYSKASQKAEDVTKYCNTTQDGLNKYKEYKKKAMYFYLDAPLALHHDI